jgi:hypothetical protein
MDRRALLEPVNLRDVRVIEGRERLRFALESRQPIGVAGKRLGQDLDRDVATATIARRNGNRLRDRSAQNLPDCGRSPCSAALGSTCWRARAAPAGCGSWR